MIPCQSEADEVIIGLRSTGSGNGPGGWFQADDFRLTYVGSLDDPDLEVNLRRAQLDATRININDYAQSTEMFEFPGLQAELNEASNDTYDRCDEDNIDSMLTEISFLHAAVEKAKACIKIHTDLVNLINNCVVLFN